MRFRIPELLLGSFLTVAVFAAGMSIQGPRNQPSNPQATQERDKGNDAHKEHGSLWNWLTHDAAGFFTLWLVIVGSGQAGLFVWQLLYMRQGMGDAKIAAEAAKDSSLAAIEANRPWVSIADVKFIDPLDSYPRGAITSIKIRTENVGKTPAIDTYASVELIPMDIAGLKLGDIQDSVRERALRGTSVGVATAIFPAQITSHEFTITVTQAQIEQHAVKKTGEPDRIAYFLGVCVCYRSGAALEFRVTSRIFSLGWVEVLSLTSADQLNARLGNSLLDTAS